jgi:hypothetical protein
MLGLGRLRASADVGLKMTLKLLIESGSLAGSKWGMSQGSIRV